MKDLVKDFPRQLREAKEIAAKAVLAAGNGISNVLVTGLGGSGIGGTILGELVSDKCPVPIIVNKDYFLPAFVNERTLLIVSSYSGNTEETLNAMQEGISKGAVVVSITSGGKVHALAKQHQLDFIEIPGGKPPRACLGYSLVQLLRIMTEWKLADKSLFDDLEKSINLLEKEAADIQKTAQGIAQKLHKKIPVIYSIGSCEGVAVRFRQQINENGKMLCWHHNFPEMNHNELVGWTTRNEDIAVVALHTSFDYERTKKRYDICRPLFEKYSSAVIDITAKGASKLEQFLYLVHLTDWVSCYLADLKGIDPTEVNVIDHLKGELAKS
jgi:glucose/mannose-6-phosphate isomerase